jgi:membrane protein
MGIPIALSLSWVAMTYIHVLLRRMVGMFARVFPRCNMLSQAIAFNLFLAFFPMLLVIVALGTSFLGSRATGPELINELTRYLPSGSRQIVVEFLIKRAPQAWKWAAVGLAGALLAGTQVMTLIVKGIHAVHGDEEKASFLLRQLRGLLLLLGTTVPLLAAAILGVFGRVARHWLQEALGRAQPLYGLWSLFFPLAAILLSAFALSIIYRVSRPQQRGFRCLLPGAFLATMLWWLVNIAFGFLVQKVPYSIVYGGLAAVIGLLIWMQLSAVIIFLGAAWNAELASSRSRK